MQNIQKFIPAYESILYLQDKDKNYEGVLKLNGNLFVSGFIGNLWKVSKDALEQLKNGKFISNIDNKEFLLPLLNRESLLGFILIHKSRIQNENINWEELKKSLHFHAKLLLDSYEYESANQEKESNLGSAMRFEEDLEYFFSMRSETKNPFMLLLTEFYKTDGSQVNIQLPASALRHSFPLPARNYRIEKNICATILPHLKEEELQQRLLEIKQYYKTEDSIYFINGQAILEPEMSFPKEWFTIARRQLAVHQKKLVLQYIRLYIKKYLYKESIWKYHFSKYHFLEISFLEIGFNKIAVSKCLV